MILNQNTKDIETNTSHSTKEFTIKTTAKAFKILSSGLYSDKIKAVIRELSCNAWDAHTMAKNNEPFVVHLPSKLEPWFSVRDYGIGLSEEDVMNLYSTYFESTKTNSNDQIGALGLGSKSPFSYADSFNVTSIWGGVSKSYTAFIDKVGTPSIVKVHEEQSDEHVGLEVKFAVDVNDYDEFARKAGTVFRVFKVKPTVIGSTNYSRYEQTLTEVLSGEGWAFCKTEFYTPRCAVALQGNIEYPIDYNQLGELNDGQKFIAHGQFYIDFKIGELDIAASREGLGYDESTIENIKSALQRVYNSFTLKFSTKIESCKTFWEAYLTSVKITEELGMNNYQSREVPLTWKGRSFKIGEDLIYHFSKTPNQDDKENRILGSGIVDSKLEITCYRRESYHTVKRVSKVGEYKANDNFEVKFTVYPSNKVAFIINDEPSLSQTKVVRKARQHAKKNSGLTVYLMNMNSKKFFNAIGNPPFIKLSSIVLDKVVRSGPSSYPEDYFMIDIEKCTYKNISYGDIEEDFDDLEGHFYFHRIRDLYYPVGSEKALEYNAILNAFNFLSSIGVIPEDKKLFAVRPAESGLKRFRDMKWISFYDFAKAEMIKYLKNNESTLREPLVVEKKKEHVNSRVDYSWRDVMLNELKVKDDYHQDSSFIKIASLLKEANDRANQMDDDIRKCRNIISIAAEFGIKIEDNFEINLDDVDHTKQYPMLAYGSAWDFKKDFSKAKAYIILVDKSKEE